MTNKSLNTYKFILIQSEDKKNIEAMSKMKNLSFGRVMVAILFIRRRHSVIWFLYLINVIDLFKELYGVTRSCQNVILNEHLLFKMWDV